jgi:hypothetical protein
VCPGFHHPRCGEGTNAQLRAVPGKPRLWIHPG